MSVAVIAGTRYAAGLYWEPRSSAPARNARQFRRPFVVHWGDQTGFGAGEPESTEGLPSLALALVDHIDRPRWMALVACQGNRFVLVKARDGAVEVDGDEVFDARADALAAFERSRDPACALFATPGLVSPPVVDLDIAALTVSPTMTLRPVSSSARPRKALAAAALLLLLAAAGSGGWLYKEQIQLLFVSPEPVARPKPPPEPQVTVAVDSADLIAACDRAHVIRPPYLPAWELQRVECVARFADENLTALKPEYRGRPMLVARWALPSEYSRPLHRRIAEEHLLTWTSGSVAADTAWGVWALDPVLRQTAAAPRSFADLRHALDRRLGTAGFDLEFVQENVIRLRTTRPLRRVAELVDGVTGLEVTRLSRGPGGPWLLEGRPLTAASMKVSQFENITREILR